MWAAPPPRRRRCRRARSTTGSLRSEACRPASASRPCTRTSSMPACATPWRDGPLPGGQVLRRHVGHRADVEPHVVHVQPLARRVEVVAGPPDRVHAGGQHRLRALDLGDPAVARPRATSNRCTCASATSRWSSGLSLATQWYSRTPSVTGPAPAGTRSATRVTWKFCRRHRCSRRPTSGCTPRTRASSANSAGASGHATAEGEVLDPRAALVAAGHPDHDAPDLAGDPAGESAPRAAPPTAPRRTAGASAQVRYRSATRTRPLGRGR